MLHQPDQTRTTTSGRPVTPRLAARTLPPRALRPRALRPVLATALATVVLATTGAGAAAAAGPIAHDGDLLLVTQGGLFTGVGIDRIDPKTALWERAASFAGDDSKLNAVSVAPDGTWIVKGKDFLRIDPATGKQTRLPTPSTELFVLDMAVDRDGTVVVLHVDRTATVVSLSRYNPSTGSVHTIATGGHLTHVGTEEKVLIESDGDVLVVYEDSLVRVSADGRQTVVHTFPSSSYRAVALSPAGDVYTIRTDRAPVGDLGIVTRLNPRTGVETTIAKNANLAMTREMTVGADGALYAAGQASEDDDVRRIARIDPTSGAYRAIRDVGSHDAEHLAVAGRFQVPARPTAARDTYDTDEGRTLTTTATNGVLANDRDGLGNPMIGAHLVENTHKGDLRLNADGTFTYTPAAFSTGTDTFTYEATDSRGNRSGRSTVTIRIHSLSPLAAPDSYRVPPNKAFTTGGAGRPSVLANDQNPGGTLEVLTLAKPAHGTLKLGNDGNFTYTPKTGYTGTDKFTYQLYNGTDFSFPTDVTLTVKA